MDITTYLVIALALAAGAVVKGVTGMGLPLVALPFLTAAVGLQHAVGILTIPILLTNAMQLYSYRDRRGVTGTEFLLPFLAGGGVGVAVGTWALVTVPERWLVLGLGGLLLAYVVMRLTRPALMVTPHLARIAAIPVGSAAGALQGATGISAPVGVTFIHAMRLERRLHIFAVSAMFLLFGIVQFGALIVSGLMQPEWYLQGLFALIPVALFLPVGQLMAHRLSARAFDMLILIFLGVMGLKMVLGV